MRLYPWFSSSLLSLPFMPVPAPISLRSCTQLNLLGNDIGTEGAKALAAGLAANASLTRLDARVNDLGEEGKAMLRKAVEGRSGFELQL